MEFDVIFSIGPACRPANYLAQNFLRLFSSPLDWQMMYGLDTVLTLFRTRFETFFVNIRDDTEGATAVLKNRIVTDVENHITSIHHFNIHKTLEEAQKDFYSAMLNRYRHLHSKIRSSRHVGLICNRSDTIDELTEFLLSFSAIYPGQQLTLINIRNDETAADLAESKYKINKKLTIIESIFNDTNEQRTWTGNEILWNRLLNDYRISNHPVITYINRAEFHNHKIVIYGAGEHGRACTSFLKNIMYQSTLLPLRTLTAILRLWTISLSVQSKILILFAMIVL